MLLMSCNSTLPIISCHTEILETSRKIFLRSQANPVPESHSCTTELLLLHVCCVLITQTSSNSVILPSIEFQHSVLLQKDFFDDLLIRNTFANFHTSASTSFIKASNKASLLALNADKRPCRNIDISLKPLNRAYCISFLNQQHYHFSKPFTEENITSHGEFFSP